MNPSPAHAAKKALILGLFLALSPSLALAQSRADLFRQFFNEALEEVQSTPFHSGQPASDCEAHIRYLKRFSADNLRMMEVAGSEDNHQLIQNEEGAVSSMRAMINGVCKIVPPEDARRDNEGLRKGYIHQARVAYTHTQKHAMDAVENAKTVHAPECVSVGNEALRKLAMAKDVLEQIEDAEQSNNNRPEENARIWALMDWFSDPLQRGVELSNSAFECAWGS